MSGNLLDFSRTEEEQQVLELLDEICINEIVPRREKLDEDEEFPFEILKKFKEAGMYGALFPEAYGGLGFDGFLTSLISELVSKYCLGVNTAFSATKLDYPLSLEEPKNKNKSICLPWQPAMLSVPFAFQSLMLVRMCLTFPLLQKKGDRYIQTVLNNGYQMRRRTFYMLH